MSAAEASGASVRERPVVNRRQAVTGAVLALLLVAFVMSSWSGTPISGQSLLNLVLFSLPIAGIYALTATGLVVVYSTTGVFNFAQGAFGMVAAYLGWQLTVQWGLPAWLAYPLIVVVFAPLFGVLLERVLMRHLQGKTLVVQLMVTVGLLFGLIGLVDMLWDQNVGRSLPFLFGDAGVRVGSVTLTWHRIITVVLSVALVAALRVFLQRTRFGVSMRAVVDNPDLARSSGARPAVVSMCSWALGCSLGSVAGILLAPETDMSPGGSLTLLVLAAFAAGAVGRFRSLPLTYLGALILAGFTQFSQTFLHLGGRWTDVPGAYPAIMLFCVLLLLPESRLQSARLDLVTRPARVSSVRDTAIGMAVVVAIMAVLGGILSATNVNRLGLAMCTALVILSLVPLVGWAGQVSLAPLAFAGIGAVAYSHIGPGPLGVLVAGLVAVPIGALLALPALRLQGLYLALATFSFATVASSTVFSQPFAFAGQSIDTPRMAFLGVSFAGQWAFLVLATVVFALASVALAALYHGRFGRRLVAMRDSEVAAATIGVNVAETKLIAFMFSAFLAGVGGVFLGQFYVATDASTFAALAGVTLVLALVIGGIGNVAGALYGGVFLLLIAILQDVWDVPLVRSLEYLGPALAALAIISAPAGAVGAIGRATAHLLPWRTDAKILRVAQHEAATLPEVGELGLTRSFTEADVIEIDRALGIAREVPRPVRDLQPSSPGAGGGAR